MTTELVTWYVGSSYTTTAKEEGMFPIILGSLMIRVEKQPHMCPNMVGYGNHNDENIIVIPTYKFKHHIECNFRSYETWLMYGSYRNLSVHNFIPDDIYGNRCNHPEDATICYRLFTTRQNRLQRLVDLMEG